MLIQYNKGKSERPRKIKGFSDLSLFFFHLFQQKSAQNKREERERLHERQNQSLIQPFADNGDINLKFCGYNHKKY
ncbi:hypothetical protein CE91St54_19180 [Hungatella hathewayi]|uniref:Uncharacterized protein n=2 Tax=Hungatella hathewayi TaxID=154046 RepID=D3AAY3_9FIRM|nr:hypothetical protein CLOSTHATH_00754 [Hungatella hathewayi DSM 13479]RGZ05872.1 hypothetical protein DXA14_06540 [Hungatella hathewayi]RHB68793.1 hypothetical protein DW876_16795 [Hungatella hathewayi]GKG99987.1 hypothetical protein CE91St55_19690 [Hungatella hathewayi]GKH06810.1 hypothetical protein CE91St54_19180 [Hungatella hathewayi]